MKKYSRKLAALAAAASLALTGTLAGCSSSGSDHKIRIGIKFDQPGLGYQDGSQYTGFDVEVARYVAGKLGYSENQIINNVLDLYERHLAFLYMQQTQPGDSDVSDGAEPERTWREDS